MGGFDAHRSDCADGGAIDPILEIRPPAGIKDKCSGGGWRGFCRTGTATGAEPGESCGGVFSVGCGVGEPGTAQGTVERVPFTGRSAFGEKNYVSRGDAVEGGGVGSGLNTTPQQSKPSGHRKESNSQTDARRA